MLQLGKYQSLVIDRFTSVGAFLVDPTSEEDVLLPNQYLNDDMQVEDSVTVFVYRDNEERVIATTQEPFLTVGEFAYLEVKEVSKNGAFVEWGLMKQLLVPFRNQAREMELDKHYIVYLYEDELTQRLVGTTKIDALIRPFDDEHLNEGDPVNILVRGISDLGAKVIVNNAFNGLIYHSDIYTDLTAGHKSTAYISKIREDGKLDIVLKAPGYDKIEGEAKIILDKLLEADGFLGYTDKSDPEEIKAVFGMSKKVFKKSLGLLYKQRLITLSIDGISKV